MPRALGTDDTVTACDCCGKSPLNFTVVIELDDGEIAHYGTTCASRNTGKAGKQINAEIKAHRAAKAAAARAEYLASPEYIAERARFAERDEVARRTGVRMVGLIAMKFMREACDAAETVRKAIAAKHGIDPYAIHA